MFDVETLLICIIGTVIIFFWLFKYKEKKARIFFLFFVLMYLIYSGIGASLPGVSPEYISYYFIFSFCISIGVFCSLKCIKNNNKTIKKSWCDFLSYFINKYGNGVFVIYFILLLFPLIYPEFKLPNLIHPPAPDVISMLREKFNSDEGSILITIVKTLKSIIYPFYLLCLYRLRLHILKLCIAVIFPYYIMYCDSGYLGRGSMLEAFLLIIAFVYFERPKFRKAVLICGVTIIPVLLVFFVQYSKIRIGVAAGDISSMDALALLIEQESGYPEHFSTILKHDNGKYLYEFIIWLLTMPLPGFFRGGMDVHFAAIFSEDMLGISRHSSGFYILLPGVVGESVFLLGKYMFWISGLIYGILMGTTYRLFTRYPQLIGILIFAALDFGYVTNRAGLYAGIPFVLKILVYFYLFLSLFKKFSHYSSNQELCRKVM